MCTCCILCCPSLPAGLQRHATFTCRTCRCTKCKGSHAVCRLLRSLLHPFAAPQVSEGMRSLGASVSLLTVAVGTYLASGLNVLVAAASPHDTWVSNNPLFGHYDW
eukprot:GHRQ01014147.1.p2 GENE.GHRQ01014147.1~~GHRQ01014147.1.p2  ORF type:complete len:106 (-),score=15.49 GHRQ01014147.1:732-1049(-)